MDTRKKAAVVLASLVVTLLVIEIATHALPILPQELRLLSNVNVKDDYYYLRLRGDVRVESVNEYGERVVFETNPLGYKDYYVRDDTPTGDVWAVTIGDSFTEGGGTINSPDTWANVLERETGRTVANLAVGGQFSITEERILTDYGLPLEPEVVLWQFFENDIDDAAGFEPSGSGLWFAFRNFMNERSNMWLLAKKAYISVQSGQGEYNTTFLASVDGVDHRFQTLERMEQIYASCDGEASDATKEALLAAKTKSEAAGAEFVLILVPMQEELYKEEIYPNAGDIKFYCPIDVVKAFAEENGIDAIDMGPVYAANIEEGGLPYLPINGHLTKEGHVLTARTVRDHLAEGLQ